MEIFVVITASIFALIFYKLHRALTYWSRWNVPHVKPEFPYGNARGVGETMHMHHFTRAMYAKLKSEGPLVGVYMFVIPMAMATDLDLIKFILVKDFGNFPYRGSYHNERDDPAGSNVATIDSEGWKELRNKLTPTFTSGKIKLMLPLICEIADRLIEKLATAGSSPLEVEDICCRFIIDVTGKVSFGIECNSLESDANEFYKLGSRDLNKITFWKMLMTTNFPELSRKLRITTTDPEATAFFREVIVQTIKYRDENNIKSHDFLSLLTKMMREGELTFNEVWAQSTLFLLVGHETNAFTMTYCIYELSQNREIQRRARESVKVALERHNGEFSYEAVSEMHYIEQCVNETLRKYPPIPLTKRVVLNDYNVPNTSIQLEKGVQVYIPIAGIHYDPDIYPDPDKFNPDRFTVEEVAKRHKFAFIPFGEGPRICIAPRFVMVELKLAIAKILINFELELDRAKTPVPMVFDVKNLFLSPGCEIYVKFRGID